MMLIFLKVIIIFVSIRNSLIENSIPFHASIMGLSSQFAIIVVEKYVVFWGHGDRTMLIQLKKINVTAIELITNR